MPKVDVMARQGRSLHVGLNRVDPAHYEGWNGALRACEQDARDLEAMAGEQGYVARRLLTREATAAAVAEAIGEAAESLRKGDTFLLTYSGHGGQVPDRDGDEPDHADETWVLYDRQMIDDELYALWARFRAGVRIAVLSDSCHSGTVTRARAVYRLLGAGPRFRLLPAAVGRRVYAAHRALYDRLAARSGRPGGRAKVKATVLLISGCQDNQYSLDGDRNGLFTGTLKQVWDGGRFEGGWRAFRRAIAERMPPTQSPNYYRIGPANPDFEDGKPFTI